MATAAPLATLEDLAYCPVCFEFYNNPQSLACRHVLCENCVQGLLKYEQVECPECRHKSLLTEIKKDFNKQSLVELYIKQQESEGSLVSMSLRRTSSIRDVPLCKSCQQPKKVEWNCQECCQTMCNDFFGEDCNKAHASFPVTKQHHVTSIEEIAKDITQNIDQTIELLKSQKERITSKLKEEADIMQQLLSVKNTTIEDINCHRESLKKCIDEHHDSIVTNVEKLIAAEMQRSNSRQKSVYGYSTEIKQRIKILTDLKLPQEISNLVDKGKVIANDICTGIQRVDAELDDIKLSEVPVIKVIGSAPWDSELGTKVVVNSTLDELRKSCVNSKPAELTKLQRDASVRSRTSESQDSIIGSDDNISTCPSVNSTEDDLKKDASSMVSHGSTGSAEKGQGTDNLIKLVRPNTRFKKQLTIKVDSIPWKLAFRADNICCTLSDGFLLYDLSGEIIKSVKFDKVQKVRSLENDGNDIIAATKDGLHLLDVDGKLLQTIRDGKYSAVSIHKGLLYALEYKKKKVVVFQCGKFVAATARRQWTQIKSIALHSYVSGCDCDTLHVTKQFIHVGSDVSCCIYRYSHNGSLICKYGKSGVVKTDELYKPRLAGMDSNDNLLICDYFNNHVKVCTDKEQWRKLSIIGGLVKPTAALVVGEDGNDIWIGSQDNNITLYSTLK